MIMLWDPQSQARTVLKYNAQGFDLAQYIIYLRTVLACIIKIIIIILIIIMITILIISKIS